MDSEQRQKLKDLYNQGTLEDKTRIINSINDQITMLMHAEFGTLPTISAISAAMLIITTFNSQLLPLTILVKILISTLILITPISLVFYQIRIRQARTNGEILLEIYLGRKPEMAKGFFNYILNTSPFILAAIISVVVVIILILIWQQPLSSQIPLMFLAHG